MTSAMMTGEESTLRMKTGTGLPLLGWIVLALTAVMAIMWSTNKILKQDEIFSLQTDRSPTLSEVFRIQAHYPISLEAPTYHVLSHAAITVLGPTAFALRLPALLGFLLMQVCLYFLVRNIAGERAGVVAMAFPALTQVLFYAAEGRPYGLMLGGCALTVLCWQVAARRGEEGEPRTLPLAGIVFALALTLTVHYYGVLVLIPLCGAELVRSWRRHRLDKPMIAAIVLGMASLATILPYVKASSEFKRHYYAAEMISWHMTIQPYRYMLLDYANYSQGVQRATALLIVLAAVAMVWGCVRALGCGRLRTSPGEVTMLVLLALCPSFAWVLGQFVTHALESRHSLIAIIAISSLAAIAMSGRLRNSRFFYGTMTALLAGALLVNGARGRESGAEKRTILESLHLSQEQNAALHALSDRNIYFQDMGAWEVAYEYVQDPELRSRLVLVQSLDEEMKRRGHDTFYLTAIHMMKFSNPPPIASFDDLRRSSEPHIFAIFDSGWSWTDEDFRKQAAGVTSLGRAFGGDLVKVRFR